MKIMDSTHIHKPKLLDLYCCQHGAGYGYEQAGFDVTGIDIEPQPRHPGKFIQTDAIDYVLRFGHFYDYIHASPPCQKYSLSSMQFRLLGKQYPNLIEATRAALIKVGKPYTIENVPGSPLINPIMLCGAMFNIPTYRHRLFETNWNLGQPLHLAHVAKNAKMGRFPKNGEFIQYVGHFPGVQYVRDFTGCHWMNQYGLAQSIPPQYTKYIGEQFLKYKRDIENIQLNEIAHEYALDNCNDSTMYIPMLEAAFKTGFNVKKTKP